jgi:hypothetical protein
MTAEGSTCVVLGLRSRDLAISATTLSQETERLRGCSKLSVTNGALYRSEDGVGTGVERMHECAQPVRMDEVLVGDQL